jgi:hypothetical protein
MAQFKPISGSVVRLAEVVAVDSDNRAVKVNWVGRSESKDNVIVVGPPGDFSMPKPGDRGLVVEVNEKLYFYIGNVEFGYKQKIDGVIQDALTGTKLLAKRVLDGEVFISNLAYRAWLSISNGGDFALLNGFNEGLKYFQSFRLLRLAGMTLNFIGQGAQSALGTVMRDLPGVGKVAIPSDNPLVPAVEYLVDLLVTQLRLVRFHIGHVKDTTLGIDEFGSP